MPTAIQDRTEALTARQKECLLLLKDGMTSKQIARELDISPRTVDQHIAVALESLGVRSRLEAISMLHEQELLESTKSIPPSWMPDRPTPANLLRKSPSAPSPKKFGRSPPTRGPLFPPVGGSVNTASTGNRITWMVRLAILCVMLTCLMVLSVLGVSEMVSSAPA